MKISELSYPVLIAHRGLKGKYPENTLASFQGALDAGAKMIEFDVSLTKDRSLVVIHDDTLERTTNGEGKVCEHPLQEIRKLDAGSWFASDFKGEKVPTLEEVLDLIQGKAAINIEIKKESYEPENPPDAIEKQVLEIVKRRKLEDSVIISSFEKRYLERIFKEEGCPRLAFISLEALDDQILSDCKRMNLFSWNVWWPVLTTDQVTQMHQEGFKVFSFTVEKPDEFEKINGLGVDGIFADDITLFQ